MWFTQQQFLVCQELRQWGLEPRFEPGDVVARGFADLGFEEFQVLPGSLLLSLTAGTTRPLPADHIHHFFWIPSIDEGIDLLEKRGIECRVCMRENQRSWAFELKRGDEIEIFRGTRIHDVVLQALRGVWKKLYASEEP